MARATRTKLPDDVTDVRMSIEAAEARLAALRTLGVRAPELEDKVTKGRAALAVEDLVGAQARADEVRIVVKLAATEIERMLNHGDALLESGRDQASGADATDQVEAVVQESFAKALHSNALRQMVEIVAAERLREFLQDPAMLGPLIDERVRAAMREALELEQAGSS